MSNKIREAVSNLSKNFLKFNGFDRKGVICISLPVLAPKYAHCSKML